MKKIIYIILIAVILLAIIGFISHNVTPESNEITEIPIESVKGIEKEEAEALCYAFMGEKDEATGFLFSFGVSTAIKQGKNEYYVIRASWLVDNSHLSYIGDFFVSSDGEEIYNGLALNGEFEILEKIWSKKQ